MADLEQWSTTAASNNLTVPDGAPENWTGSQVNNWGRETMASVRGRFELDQWRNLVVEPGGTKRTLTRVSATVVKIVGINYTAKIFAGERIRVVNAVATAVEGVVVSAVLNGSDTDVTVKLDGSADGTADIGAGNLTFAAAGGTITSDGSGGGGPSPFTGIASGDRVRITGSVSNNGYYDVTGATGTVLTVTPRYFTMVNEGPVAAASYWIDDTQDVPSAPLADFFIAGSHTDQIKATAGTDPTEFPKIENLADGAFKREADMSVATAANALKLNGDTQGAGGGIDADTVDGIEAADLEGRVQQFTLASVFNITPSTAEQVITGLDNLAIPYTPDGVRDYLAKIHVVVETTGSSTGHTLRIRIGPNGDITDPVAHTSAAMGFSGEARRTFFHPALQIDNPASGDKMTFTIQMTNAVSDLSVKAFSNTIRPVNSSSIDENAFDLIGSFVTIQRRGA